jgi:hypothetical protein
MRELQIFGLELIAFLLLTVNFRAIAKGFVKTAVGTDVLIAAVGFTLTKMIADAEGLSEQVAYVLGAAGGSVLGMRLTRRWDDDQRSA